MLPAQLSSPLVVKKVAQYATLFVLLMLVCMLSVVLFLAPSIQVRTRPVVAPGTDTNGGGGGDTPGRDSGQCIPPPIDYSTLTNVPQSCFGIVKSDPSVCSGHGSCTWLNKCECSLPYTGPNCSVRMSGIWCFGVRATDAGVCGGHGACTANDLCHCADGYTGANCTTAADVGGEPSPSPAVSPSPVPSPFNSTESDIIANS
jgi:hypothetical protein